MAGSTSKALTKPDIDDMIAKRDFAAAEGHVPELIAVLLQMAVPAMQQGIKHALENEKVRIETYKYIHETSKKAIDD